MPTLWRVWDETLQEFYMGNYGGLKAIGKLYRTEAGAKKSLAGFFLANASDKLTKPVFPGHSAPLEDKRAYWSALQKHHEQSYDLWTANKHKPFDELFGPRYKLVPFA